jgi:hypothetical protein
MGDRYHLITSEASRTFTMSCNEETRRIYTILVGKLLGRLRKIGEDQNKPCDRQTVRMRYAWDCVMRY